METHGLGWLSSYWPRVVTKLTVSKRGVTDISYAGVAGIKTEEIFSGKPARKPKSSVRLMFLVDFPIQSRSMKKELTGKYYFHTSFTYVGPLFIISHKRILFFQEPYLWFLELVFVLKSRNWLLNISVFSLVFSSFWVIASLASEEYCLYRGSVL